MANELRATAKVVFSKDNTSITRGETVSVDISGSKYSAGVQPIGTVAEVIAISADLGTVGYVWLRNLSDTYSIDIGLESTTDAYGLLDPFITLYPGQVALFPAGDLATNGTYYACSRGAAANLEFVAFEI